MTSTENMSEGSSNYADLGVTDSKDQHGLQLLMPLGEFHVIRDTQTMSELLCPYKSRRTYKVLDENGQEILIATELADNCRACCCGRNRPWEFRFQDSSMNEIFKLSREINWWLQEADIHAEGCFIGSVKQKFTWCYPTFYIRDDKSENVMLLVAPCCWGCDVMNVNIQVMTLNGEIVGVITKQWTKLAREFLRNGNYFSFSLPKDLDVKLKAVLIAAAVLMDFIWWSTD